MKEVAESTSQYKNIAYASDTEIRITDGAINQKIVFYHRHLDRLKNENSTYVRKGVKLHVTLPPKTFRWRNAIQEGETNVDNLSEAVMVNTTSATT